MLRLPAATVLAALALAAPAAGDGLPVGGVDAGPQGVAGEALRYVTLDTRGGTMLAAVRRDGGQVERSVFLHGPLTIPAVALDGSASGLAADGRTLVLIRPRRTFPQRRTVLAVVAARTLRVRRTLRLRGDFSFDALSPDGRTIFLIQYVAPRDPTRYLVRAYDVAAGRLERAPVVDPREPDERMRGLPLTRTTSADGRWAYTLYDGAGHTPFVHALDTVARRAACIDLDALAGRTDLTTLRLAARGPSLAVVSGRRPVVHIDTRTFAVRRPAARHPETVDASGGTPPWIFAGVIAAVAMLATAGVRRRLATG